MASLEEENSRQDGKYKSEYDEYLEKHPLICQCLNNNFDIDTQDTNGRTAVFHLVETYHPIIANNLFRKKPNVNIPDYDGIYPIHLAARTGTDVLNILIKHGADKMVVDKFKRTPLHFAAYYGSEDAIQRLLQDEKERNETELLNKIVNAVDLQGNSAAHYAAMRNEGKIMLTFLKSLGANTNIKNVYGKLPLHYATRSALTFLVNEQKGNMNDDDNERKTVLHHLSSVLNTKRQVELLIKNGIDVNKCDRQGCNALMLACKSGSTETVKYLLTSSNIEVNVQDNLGNTALHYACRRQEGMSHAKALIDKGADINKQNILGKTPLMNAIETHISDTADKLILATVNVQIKDRASRSLLHYACLTSNCYTTSTSHRSVILENTMDIIRKLCDMGIDVNSRDVKDMTALHYACQVKGGKDIVKLLIDSGAGIHFVDHNNMNAIQHAIKDGDFVTVKFLIKHIINVDNIYQPDDGEMLMAARFASVKVLEFLCNYGGRLKTLSGKEDFLNCLCHSQRKVILEFFLEHHFDVNVQDKNGNSLLLIALQCATTPDIANYLVMKGADITGSNNNGQQPIHMACKFCDLETVELLWKLRQQQSKISKAEDHFKRNPLHYAAQNSRTSVFEFLLKKGINVNAKDKDGKNALHFGGKFLTEKAVELFVSCGGNINARDGSDRTALYFAAQEGNLFLVKGLLNQGIKVDATWDDSNSPLFIAVERLKTQAVEILLQQITNIERCNDIGSSLVHRSVHNGEIKILNLLLKSEFPLTPIEGKSPLHIASELSNLEAVRSILKFESGKNVLNDITETEGRSALHIAAKNGDKRIVYTLSICGAKLNLKDKESNTALHLAAKENHTSVTSLLVFHGADCNIADKNGATALHITVIRNNIRLTSLLLKSGASTEAKNADGHKPLFFAKCPKMKRLLANSEVNESKIEEADHPDEGLLLPYHGNICLLEMIKRHLPAVGFFYAPTDQAKKTIDHIKKKLKPEERANMNFLIFERNTEIVQTSKTRVGLVKYACLHLAAQLSSSIPDDITKHCHDLNVVITEVMQNRQIELKTEDLATQIRKAKEDSSTKLIHDDDQEYHFPSTSKDRTDDPLLQENLATEMSKDKESLNLLQLLQKYLCRLGLLSDEDTRIFFGTEIHTWISRKNWHQTYLYIQQKKSLDVKDKFGWTPLHHCILHDMEEFVALFLQNNVNVNADTTDIIPFPSAFKDDDIVEDGLYNCLSPLFLAVILERDGIIRYLADEHVNNKDIAICIKVAFSGNSELPILNGLCKQLERRYTTFTLRAFPGYLHETPLKRTLLGISPRVFRIKKGTFLSQDMLIRNPDYCNRKEQEETSKKRHHLKANEGRVIKEIISTHASRLWQCHSALNIITGASLQDNKPCVAVYVTIKEFVPLFERPIPETLKANDVELDVIVKEGKATLGTNGDLSIYMASYNTPMRMGSAIGSLGGLSGTMGPIVSLDEDNLGFLTCAHIFFNNDINKQNVPIIYEKLEENAKKVVQPTDKEEEMHWENYRDNTATEETDMDIEESQSNTHQRDSEWRVCGEVIKAVFDTSDKNPVSIDAALVKITIPERNPRDGKFWINPSRYLGSSYRPVFNSGEVGNITDNLDSGTEVIKCGATTGVTRGAVVFDETQVRFTVDTDLSLCCCQNRADGFSCNCMPPNFTMKGQYQVQSNNNQAFFELGDSGAGVFITDKDENLICVGIAVGFFPFGIDAIVTPIKDVLTSLGDYKLKKFLKRPCDADDQHHEHQNVKRLRPS